MSASAFLAPVALGLTLTFAPSETTPRVSPPTPSTEEHVEDGCCSTASASVDCYCDGKWHLNKCQSACGLVE